MGTPLYMAPGKILNTKKKISFYFLEILENKQYSNKSDMWSLGIVFY